ncbi:MAG: hypothetical protein GTO24_15620 [candidate division Zixibacteria bacterium]|nr:hypothetical protein [candidate division Zixibacteria bacterium]
MAERLDVTDRTIRNDKRDMKRMLRPYLDKPDCIEPFHKQLHSSWPSISTLARLGHMNVAPDEEIAECPYCHCGVLRKKGKGEPYQCTRCDTPMPWKH